MPISIATRVVKVDGHPYAEGACPCGRAFQVRVRVDDLAFVCSGCEQALFVDVVEAWMQFRTGGPP